MTMRDEHQRPQLSVEDLEPPPEANEQAKAEQPEVEPRGVAVIWPPADEE
jgi:hypothetical protein